MLDISSNFTTYREAKAQAIIKASKKETIEAITDKEIFKGDVFEVSQTAGKLAIKRTAEVIPDCHSLPLDNIDITYEINQLEIEILVCLKAVAKTGFGVEAMYGASVVAVTIYDMLNGLDKELEITSIRLLEKSGGRSEFNEKPRKGLKAGIIICSNAIVEGKKENKAGKIIKEKLDDIGLEIIDNTILPNDKDALHEKILSVYESVNLLIIAGGTGLLPRDITPETVRPLLDKEIPGISEAARNYGQDRTPLAMLSRSLAGTKGDTLVLVIPGSSRGAEETMNALFPYVLHVFKFKKLSN